MTSAVRYFIELHFCRRSFACKEDAFGVTISNCRVSSQANDPDQTEWFWTSGRDCIGFAASRAPADSALFLGRSITSYLLLTAFDLSLGLMLIIGTTRDRSDPTTVDPRATWLASRLTAVLVLAIFFGIVAAIITVPIGMPVFIFGLTKAGNLPDLLSHPNFWVTAAVMAIATGTRAQLSFESVTTPGERGTSPYAAPVIGDLESDRRRSKAANAAQVTIIATYVALSYLLINFGQRGLFILPILFAAFLVFYDTRPALAQRIFPRLWRQV
jgi:hypothetical protein